MILYGKIINQAGSSLPGVTVTVADVNGYAKGIAVAADSNGEFFINSPILLANDKLIFTSAEFNPVTVSAQSIANDVAIYPSEGALITMQQKVKEIENVTVTATKKDNTALLLAGGLLLLAVIDDDKKKNQVSGFYNYYKGLPPMAKGAVVIGGGLITYFTLKKLFKKPPGIDAVKDADAELNQITNAGINPNYPGSQYNAWADQIANQFAGCDPTWYFVDGFSYSGRMLNNIIKNIFNDADFLSLVKAYGVREYDDCGYFTGDINGNLYQAVSDELTQDEISKINATLRTNGITNYKF